MNRLRRSCYLAELGVSWNRCLESINYFLFNVKEVMVLKTWKLGKFCSPDWLDFWVHSCRRNNGAGNRVLVLVKESDVLQANQSEEVYVLLHIR